VAQRAEEFDGLVPVVKGNGYGFGRERLANEAARLSVAEVAVGSAYEVDSVQRDGFDVIVLTPLVAGDPRRSDTIATVGHERDLEHLGAGQRVIVKIAGPMRRYGMGVADSVAMARRLGDRLHGFAIHMPLDINTDNALATVDSIASDLPVGARFYVSHFQNSDLNALQQRHPNLRLRHRVGTALWLGDKSHLHLGADVVDVRSVAAGERAGYRQAPIPGAGHLVMISAGTAHGVSELPDGRSPFHFARTRLALHEAPHMHTSMAFVPTGQPCPEPGDRVDVQRPLTRVWPDRVDTESDPLP
jgi:alanine racemase